MSRKQELYDLVPELHGAGVTSPRLLGEILKISERHVRRILADFGLQSGCRYATAAAAMNGIGQDLARRVVAVVSESGHDQAPKSDQAA